MDIKYILSVVSCGVLSLAACSNESNLNFGGNDIEPDLTGDVSVLISSSNKSYDLDWKSVNYSEKDNLSPYTININPGESFQTLDGFGAAITGASCYNLLKMNESDRKAFLTQTFSPDNKNGFGFSYIRISIGCSDFSLSEYTCCDTKGIENFALTNEELNYIIPILKEILAINPDLKIMGTPWTCPKWMKVADPGTKVPYDSWTGGHLNPDYYQDYAEYFVKWITAFKEHGINIYSVTPQNEPLNPGNSASMLMWWSEEQAFVRDALGPKLRAAGLDTKIYAFDHNFNYDGKADQNKYPLKVYADANAAQYFAGAAYHDYGGQPEEMLDINSSAPDKELVFTEASIGEWNDGRNLSTRLTSDMQRLGLTMIRNYCKAVIVWNLMLDTDKGPNRDGGCQTCFGAVDISNDDYKTITRNSHYYVIAHLSSVVKPGAKRISSYGYEKDGLTYEAFQNVDGSYALVLCNDSSEKLSITVDDGERHFTYAVPAKSAVSYKWNKK